MTKTPSPASRQQRLRARASPAATIRFEARDRGQRAVAGAARAEPVEASPSRLARVGVVEVGSQRAALDQRRAAARHALAVEGGRGGAGRVAAVVVEGEGLAGDLLAEPAGEGRAAALHRAGAEAAADQAGEAGGDGRVEDDRAGARGGLAGADHRQRPLGRPRRRSPPGRGRRGRGRGRSRGRSRGRRRPRPAPAGRRSSWRTRTRRRPRSRRRSRPARRSRRRRRSRPRPGAGRRPARCARRQRQLDHPRRSPTRRRWVAEARQRLDLGRLRRRGELVLVGDRGRLRGAGGDRATPASERSVP